MDTHFYHLGQTDAYYGVDCGWMVNMRMLNPEFRDAYLNGYADYLECYV